MACFLVPAAEAVVVSAVHKFGKKNPEEAHEPSRLDPFKEKAGWLEKMLWGGSSLLAFEHFWHGELIASFPFLSAAADPASLTQMLTEMSTVGVGMAAAVTGIWGLMVVGSKRLEDRSLKLPDSVE